MTKRDLVVRIARETGLTQVDVGKVIQKTLDYITESLERRENVELRDFGVFKVKHRGARKGRNPNRPEHEVEIPARNVVVFKSGKRMRDLVETEL
ncbi:MAG: HU family DNA-binding protein [Candidatus Auribacterota bacterium]|jgi:nucleoid DNA-binding protein|nr:HU family DNA-binding protein [Candidatus Auribacterota bacterium]